MPESPPFIGYTGDGTMKNMDYGYNKIDFDLGPIHIHHILGSISYRIEGYTPQWVTMYVRVPHHPGPGDYPLLSYAGPIVMFNGMALALSSFDQMMDIDGWPYFRLSFLMLFWGQYKDGTSYADVSIAFEYPYQQSMSAGPSPATSIALKPQPSINSHSIISSMVSETMLEVIKPSIGPTIDLKRNGMVIAYAEHNVQDFGPESSEIIGKITSINTEYGHGYTIDIHLLLLVTVNSKDEPIRVSRHMSWMRSVSVLEEFNTYSTMDVGSLAQVPSNFFPEESVVIEPLDAVHTFMRSTFRYRIVPEEGTIISTIKMTASIRVMQC